jgi:hypothetical protein
VELDYVPVYENYVPVDETGALLVDYDVSLWTSEAAPYSDGLVLPAPQFLDAGDEWLTTVRKVCPFC